MTELSPHDAVWWSRSVSSTWSRWTETSTLAAVATATVGRDGLQPATVEHHGVLADLQDDRSPGPLGALHDALGVLKSDDVEGRDAAARCARLGDEVGRRYERHSSSWGLTLAVSISRRGRRGRH